MRKKFTNVFKHRIIEMFAGSVFLSVIICLICISGFAPVASIQRDILLLLGPIIYLAWNTLMLRNSIFFLEKRRDYFLINICAQAVFLAANVIVYTTLPDEVYSWLFIITGFMRFSSLDISAYVSVALFHIIAASTLFVAIIDTGWIKKREIEVREYIENMPPPLKESEEKSV